MVCMSKGLRKGILVSGLAGALVLSGFGGESSGLAFVGPVNVSAAELSDADAKKLEARLVELDNKSNSIVLSMHRMHAFDRVNHIYRGFNDFKIQVSNEIQHLEIEIASLKGKLATSESKRSELDNKLRVSKVNLISLDKKIVTLSKSKSVSSKKELEVVKRQSNLERLNFDRLTNDLLIVNSSIKSLKLSIDNNVRSIGGLKTLLRYADGKLSGLDKEKAAVRSSNMSFHSQLKGLLDELFPTTKSLNSYKIQQEIIRKNGNKSVKTKTDYKNDLDVVESMIKTNDILLKESATIYNRYLSESEKQMEIFEDLKYDLGGITYDKEMIRLESLLLDSKFSIDSKMYSVLKSDKASHLKRISDMKSTRDKLIKANSKENISLIKEYDSLIKALENKNKEIDVKIAKLYKSKDTSNVKAKLSVALKGIKAKESSILSKLSAFEKSYTLDEKKRIEASSREAKLFNFSRSLNTVKLDLIEKTK